MHEKRYWSFKFRSRVWRIWLDGFYPSVITYCINPFRGYHGFTTKKRTP